MLESGSGFDIENIRRRLAANSLWRNLVYLPATESTNDVARRMARAGAPEGTLVVANEQTAGRGRRGRLWLAPAGECLLMSLLFRPRIPAHHAFALTMLAGTSVVVAVEKLTGLNCGLKWPNDVLLGGPDLKLKAAGILTELVISDGLVDSAVVGIGLNVNADMSAFPDIAAIATSLVTELGQPVDRAELLFGVLNEIQKRYLPAESFRRSGESPEYTQWRREVHLEWRSRLVTLGQWVTVSDGQTATEGLAVDVDSAGTLIVRRRDGSSIRVSAGDVSLRTQPSQGCT